MEYSTIGYILAGVAILAMAVFLYKQSKKTPITPGPSTRAPDPQPHGPKGIYDDSTGPNT